MKGKRHTSLNKDSQEWTPFSAKPVLDSSFGLPINKPRPIPLQHAPTRDRGHSVSSYADDESPPAHAPGLYSHSILGSSAGRSPTTSDIWTYSPEESAHNSPCMSPVLGDGFETLRRSREQDELRRSGEMRRSNELPHRTDDLRRSDERSYHSTDQDFNSEFGQSHSSALSSNIRIAPAQTRSRASILFHGQSGVKEEELVFRLGLYFTVYRAETTAEGLATMKNTKIDGVISKLGDHDRCNGVEFVRALRKHPANARIFVAFFSHHATVNAKAQTDCIAAGASMVTDDVSEALNTCVRALKVIGRDPFSVDDTFQCPLCGFDGLMEDELCEHVVLFHGGHPNCRDVMCPVCGVMCKNVRLPFPVHIHKVHGPVGRARQNLPRKQHHTYIFALVVVQRLSDRKFLVVNEPASWGWWIPGGRVEWGEGLRTAAIRETRDEAGVDITVKGILRLEYSSGPSRTRQRIIFYANPIDDNARPKCVPDYESRGACWVSVDEMEHLPLRGDEPRKWFKYIEGGGEIYPMSILSHNRDEEGGSDDGCGSDTGSHKPEPTQSRGHSSKGCAQKSSGKHSSVYS